METQRRLWPLYGVEALTSVSANLLLGAIFFYMSHWHGWDMQRNFLLAMGQGMAYAIGALSAAPMTRMLGGRNLLLAIHVFLSAVTALAAFTGSPPLLVSLVLIFTCVSAAVWPTIEGMVSAGADAHEMSRRVGMYNLVWSSVAAVTLGFSGILIEISPQAFFLTAAAFHVLSVALLLAATRRNNGAAPADHGHLEPEPELLRRRTLALWISRLAMPSTFVIGYGLMAMLPSLPVMVELQPAHQTLVSSAWPAARWLAFLLLGMTAWWHTRPRFLLVVIFAMLVAFLAISVGLGRIAGGDVSFALRVAWIISWEVVLGLAMGVIFAASLYFGMVLSQGSTEHGGYHEALIGLGSAVGPGLAALVQVYYPGDQAASIIAISAVGGLSFAATLAVAAADAMKNCVRSSRVPSI